MRDDYSPANVAHGGEIAQVAPLSDYARRFTPVPVASATDDRFHTIPHQLMIYVSSESGTNGWCTKTQADIARALKHNRNTISRALQKLARWGYLTIAHGAYDPETQRKYRNAYRVTAPAPTGDGE